MAPTERHLMFTKTESRILRAVRMMDEHDIAKHEIEWPDQPPVVSIARGCEDIHRLVNTLTDGRRKAGYLEVLDALQKLVAKEIFTKSVIHGMGGSFTLYVRRES